MMVALQKPSEFHVSFPVAFFFLVSCGLKLGPGNAKSTWSDREHKKFDAGTPKLNEESAPGGFFEISENRRRAAA